MISSSGERAAKGAGAASSQPVEARPLLSAGVPRLHRRQAACLAVPPLAPEREGFPTGPGASEGRPDAKEGALFDEHDGGGDPGPDDTDPIDTLIQLSPAGGPERTWEPGRAGERAQLERLAHACLEEIAATSILRQLEPRERYRWSSVGAFEQRLLGCLDALVAFGQPYFGVEGALAPGLDPAATALRYGLDAATADPGRVFASIFVLGCIDDQDSTRAALALLERLGDRDSLAAAVEALWLASSPHINDLLAELLPAADAAKVAVALDILTLRGWHGLGELERILGHHEPSLRARACRALGTAPERARATELLSGVLRAELDPGVRSEAMEALALHQAVVAAARVGLEEARGALEDEVASKGRLGAEPRRRALRLLALAGQAADHRLLTAAFDDAPGDALALGFHGHPALGAPLLERLEAQQDPSRRLELGAALARILGVPTPSADPYQPDLGPEAFRDRLAALPSALGEVRLRFGVPWSPTHSAAEIGADQVPLGVREACALELGVFLGERPVAVHDLCARQLEALGRQRAALATRLAARPHPPGRWPADP